MNKVTLYIDPAQQRPDDDTTDQWTNRIEIRSQTSNRLYTVSQHKTKRHWACSCPGWRTHRKCKHLRSMSLPAYEQPFEPIIAHK
jgi:hypothetical protein